MQSGVLHEGEKVPDAEFARVKVGQEKLLR